MIRQLIERFLDGETSLEEERALYAYFLREDVAPELADWREMFRDYSACAAMDGGFLSPSRPALRRKCLVGAVAASVLLAVIAALGVDSYNVRWLSKRYEGSYMIVDGRRVENLNAIRMQIEQTLAQAQVIERCVETNSVIRDAEQEVVASIGDPAERKRVEELLKE